MSRLKSLSRIYGLLGIAIALIVVLSFQPDASSKNRISLKKQSQQCDAAYPDFCIPSPPPDLDCAAIGRYNFTVRPPDPHHFDSDGDGIGCERKR